MKTKEWLELALYKEPLLQVKDSSERKQAIEPHGRFSTNGAALHVDDSADVCECGHKEIHQKVNKLCGNIEKTAKVFFTIDKTLLLAALSGMGDTITVYCTDKESPVVFFDWRNEDRAAVIMPMRVSPMPLNLVEMLGEHSADATPGSEK